MHVSPAELFGNHCERYARNNLHKEYISIDLCQITSDDEAQGFFAQYQDCPDWFFTEENLDRTIRMNDIIQNSKGWLKRPSMNGLRLEKGNTLKVSDNLDESFQKPLLPMLANLKAKIPNYEVLDIKICKDVHFVNGRQILVVKTWEKVRLDKILKTEDYQELSHLEQE